MARAKSTGRAKSGGGGGGWPKKGQAQKMPPDGRIRLSQMVTTFGPGALLDLVDDAVLVGGLDFWRMPQGGELVSEPRLRDAVAALFAQQKKKPLSIDAPFRKPPGGDEQNPNEAVGVQVYEFPRWFVCQNPKCRALVKANHLERKGNHYVHLCDGPEKTSERCVPIRFVGTCTRGHLDDIDWPRWVHDQKPCAAAKLRLEEGPSGDFGEISIRCTFCDHGYRRLTDLTVEQKAPRCSGTRPWLGSEGWEKCDQPQRLLVRTASNGYFAQIMSALSIPEPESLRRKVREVWKILQAATKEDLPVFRKIPDVKKALEGFSDAEVLAAVVAERENASEVLPEIRTAEFEQLTRSAEEKPGELPPDDLKQAFWARRHTPDTGLPEGISRLVLARRLREVEAQVGFTRLEPATRDMQGGYDLNVESAPIALDRDWLPAVEIQGEGFFLQLDEQRLRAWEAQPRVLERTRQLKQGFDAWKAGSGSKMPFPGARFYLLHSFSHLLMTAVALECGYPGSSIRERIYCSAGDAAVPMAAILLSTGTSGAEGTLGGLVEEGKRVRSHLARAQEDARLCSNDPVCAQHDPNGPDERHLEGAACHGCVFVPECSCERFNQFLDRALVFPTLGLEELAFFGAA